MNRSEFFQLRLTPEEKVLLSRLAQEREMSVAKMIRQEFGLALNTPVEVRESPPEPPAPVTPVNPPEPPVNPVEAPADPHLADIARRLGI